MTAFLSFNLPAAWYSFAPPLPSGTWSMAGAGPSLDCVPGASWCCTSGWKPISNTPLLDDMMVTGVEMLVLSIEKEIVDCTLERVPLLSSYIWLT